MKRTSTSWIKSNYEKLAVVGVLVLLLLASGFLALSVNKERMALSEAKKTSAAEGRKASLYELAAFDALLQRMRNPRVAEVYTNLFLVSELRVESVNSKGIKAPIPYEAKVCPFTGEPQPDPRERDSDGDGLPDWWEEQQGLDPMNPDDSILDSDGDGFTNLEEYLADPRTDPTDGASHPPIASKLRLVRMETVPFRMRFEGVQRVSDQEKFLQINMSDRTYFSKVGDEVEGFKIEAFDEQFEEREEGGVLRRFDRSVITLSRGGKQWKLRINESGSADEHFALIVNLMDKQPIRLAKEGTATIQGLEFKVLDVRPTMVLLREVKAERDWQINQVSREELLILQGRDPQMDPSLPPGHMPGDEHFGLPGLPPPAFDSPASRSAPVRFQNR